MWYREAEVQERVYVYRHHSGVSKVGVWLSVMVTSRSFLGRGYVEWAGKSHL